MNNILGDGGFEKLGLGSLGGTWKKFVGWEYCALDENDWLPSDSWGSISGTGLGSRDKDSGVTSPLMPPCVGDAGADLLLK